MTVKELIVKLLDCPMDAEVELETPTNKQYKYSSSNLLQVIPYREGAIVLEGAEE